MSDDTVLACPDCDIASLKACTSAVDHDYRCNSCTAKIDAEDVVEREPRSFGGIRGGTIAHKLDAMDPDDLGGRSA